MNGKSGTEEIYDMILRGYDIKNIALVTGNEVSYIKKIKDMMKDNGVIDNANFPTSGK